MSLKKMFYSLDEICLTLAGLSFYEVQSVSRAESGNWRNWDEAKYYLEVLIEHIELGNIPVKNNTVMVRYRTPDNKELVKALPANDPALKSNEYGTISAFETKISYEEVCKWCFKNGIINDYFESDDPFAAFIQKPITFSNNVNTPELFTELERLLKGEHSHQAEELKIAILAWFNVTNQIYAGSETKSYLKTLSKEISTLCPSLSKATIDRIATVSNWNKKGNNDYSG